MTTFHDDLNSKVGNIMIDIKDFPRYHRLKLTENDPMNVHKIKKLHNEKYELFHKTVLVPAAEKSEGKILCSKAALMWIVYNEAKEVEMTRKCLHLFPKINMDLSKWWIKEFDRPIEDLYSYGMNVISTGYQMVIDYYKDWMFTQKWERIYSKGSSFWEWYELADNQKGLMEGQESPFDLDPVMTKAKILMSVKN